MKQPGFPERLEVGYYDGFYIGESASKATQEYIRSDLTQWHDAKEPPDKDGFYVVAVDTGTRKASAFARFRNGHWWVGDYAVHLITNWTTLPQPPESDGE